MTIRFRILALLTALCLMAVGEALLVLYFQRLTLQAKEQVDQRALVRDQQALLELALLEVKSAARDAIRKLGDGSALATATADYESRMTALGGAVRDPGQQQRLALLAGHVQAWQDGWKQAAARPGADVEQSITHLETTFAPIRGDLAAFRVRQDVLYAEAQDASSRTFRRYTAIMLAIPAAAIVIMVLAIAAVRRVLLNPLGELAHDARRIEAGEYPRLRASSRTDEIGALINAFTGMIDTLHNRETSLAGALAVARELTGRYGEAKELSEQARAELETIIETVPAALLIVHRTGGVRLQNRAATMLIGPPPEADAIGSYEASFTLAGRDGAELPLSRWPLMRALEGETVSGEDVLVRSKGREMPMLVSAAPMPDASDRPMAAVVVFQDVSALKAIDRLKDEFVSIVSHELRTPLTSIRGSLQLVLDEPGSVPDDDHRQLVQIALNNCERLIRIINDILDIAKIEAGKTALHLRRCSVRDLVQTAIESVEGVARAADVAFTVHIADQLPAVDADADRIIQVIVNLLSNAVKFAPPRSRVAVEARVSGAMVEIAVSDRGAGIAPDDLPRLFQKFQQLDGSPARAQGGTGLGLAIVRGLVEQHGGTVTVQSRAGEGTRFAFTLPAAAGDRLEDAGPAEKGLSRAARVLVVDDDDDFRLVTRRHLERSGFRVVEARDGAEALARAKVSPPDVITLDLLMPGMNGWSLLRSLGEDPVLQAVPVVVLSAVADRSGQLSRDVAVVSKAAGIDTLMAEITALLPSASAGNIVVAEDDDDLRSLLAHALRKRGFTTREAADGAEALAMIDDDAVLVVLDLNMPGVDGLEVLRQLRERESHRQIPVLVITGTEGAERSAMELGASGYLTKPLNVAEVARVVQRLVSRR